MILSCLLAICNLSFPSFHVDSFDDISSYLTANHSPSILPITCDAHLISLDQPNLYPTSFLVLPILRIDPDCSSFPTLACPERLVSVMSSVCERDFDGRDSERERRPEK